MPFKNYSFQLVTCDICYDNHKEYLFIQQLDKKYPELANPHNRTLAEQKMVEYRRELEDFRKKQYKLCFVWDGNVDDGYHICFDCFKLIYKEFSHELLSQNS